MDEPHRASASDLESLELPQRLSTTTGSSSTERRSWGDSSRSNGRYEEHQLFKLQLVATRKQLKHQEARAAKAEEELVQATAYLKRVNDARLVALQEAAKAKEELVLLEDVDLQRHDAQREASEAKTLARRLNRDLVVRAALEEGRRLGLQEGLERARAIALKQQDGDAEDEYYENEEAVDARSLLLQSSEDTHESSHSAPSEPPAPRWFWIALRPFTNPPHPPITPTFQFHPTAIFLRSTRTTSYIE
ncbi:hypothetical protein DXG03_002221 [Asterophora parasitica]|uniref:Uncharacterized protein n=1 Tax=Asterophora parasitica TaxID=117018 RepID=A0A9P7KEV7_9AGAR|nr:hypothetical protein DXG03_002221 [Asterophora parasitica]